MRTQQYLPIRNDLPMHADFYTSDDKEEICRYLEKRGMHNVRALLLNLYSELKDKEETIEELEIDSGASEKLDDLERGKQKFEDYFLNEFEDEKIKIKRIGKTTFAIMTLKDLETLKSQFHNFMD